MAGTPNVDTMLEYYNKHFKIDSKPCKLVSYNCAVRLSLALNAGGLGVGDSKDPSRVHNSSSNHSHKWDKSQAEVSTVPHFIGAEDLYGHLKEKLPSFVRLYASAGKSLRHQILQQKGILFFENCFKRKNQSAKNGDHIDIWNGSQYGNELLRINAAGSSSTSEDLFDKSQKVYFLKL